MSSHNPSPDIIPDERFEAMVATASDFFFAKGANGTEGPEAFRQSAANLLKQRPHDGTAILVAGLVVAKFTIDIDTDPLTVHPPDTDNPETVLDSVTFHGNWWQILPTIIDMGLAATTRDTPEFNENIVNAVKRTLQF